MMINKILEVVEELVLKTGYESKELEDKLFRKVYEYLKPNVNFKKSYIKHTAKAMLEVILFQENHKKEEFDYLIAKMNEKLDYEGTELRGEDFIWDIGIEKAKKYIEANKEIDYMEMDRWFYLEYILGTELDFDIAFSIIDILYQGDIEVAELLNVKEEV